MNTKSILALIISSCIGLPITSLADDEGGGKRLILNLVGTGAMYLGTVPDIDGDLIDDPAFCFDVDLVNGKNRRIIGTATDCLSDITSVGDGIALVGTTYFHMSRGTLITRGKTTVQPVTQPTETPAGKLITHATAAAASGNSVIGGTRRFAGVTGSVRLGGMVNMSNFAGSEGDSIFFDCLFIVDRGEFDADTEDD